ncbi:hypothetical protein [Gluconobacter oxydans]|uniref:Uncharacterized protein n=1 Tax=Gluconobacter oxydans TaxID=442 RepID=A0A149RXM6_GLUOY|nr:hypothetical protein [Gluconobacter oxydans]KXV19234.1 hypothetical protein AD934_05295 [Gluconobacter oxydans]
MIERLLCAASALTALFGTAYAADIKPVTPIAHHVCMVLDAPDDVMMDTQHPISLMAAPSPSASVISDASVVMAVDTTQPPQNGYALSMTYTLKPGWVSTKWLKPYSAVHPGVTCSPYVMSNGKLGFDFQHHSR